MDAPVRQPMLSAQQQRFLVCLAGCIVPETVDAPAPVTDALLAAIDDQLRPRPRLQQIEFKLLLLALRWMTVPLTLRRFEHLPLRRQNDWLRFLENAPVRLVRVGIWGLKTLVFLGYYGQDSVERRIHYFPSKREGNVRLRAHRLPTDD